MDATMARDGLEACRAGIASTLARRVRSNRLRGSSYQVAAVLVIVVALLCFATVVVRLMVGELALGLDDLLAFAVPSAGGVATVAIGLVKLSCTQFDISERAEAEAVFVRYADEQTLMEIAKKLA